MGVYKRLDHNFQLSAAAYKQRNTVCLIFKQKKLDWRKKFQDKRKISHFASWRKFNARMNQVFSESIIDFSGISAGADEEKNLIER